MSKNSVVFRGKVINVSHDEVELPNGHALVLEIVHHPGGAAIVALDTDARVCLLRQYRHAAGGWIWEVPAGKLEPDEPPQVTAARELEEEAGRRAGRWESLGHILSSPGVFDEVLHLYLARDLDAVAINHESGESIEIHWVALAEALQMAYSGEIIDAKSIAALCRAQARLAAE